MKVLVAVDTGEVAEKAFDWYTEYLYKQTDEVYVCYEGGHPIFPLASSFPGGAPAIAQQDIDRVYAEHLQHLKDLNKKYTKKCQQKNINFKIVIETSTDDARHSILKWADKMKVGLIVLGSRGHGALKRAFLGSTSNYVLHHTEVPVLIYLQ